MTKRNNEKRVAGRLLTEERIGRFQGPSASLHDPAQRAGVSPHSKKAVW